MTVRGRKVVRRLCWRWRPTQVVRKRNMKVMLTLFHHSAPKWAGAFGGWTQPQMVSLFRDFTEVRPCISSECIRPRTSLSIPPSSTVAHRFSSTSVGASRDEPCQPRHKRPQSYDLGYTPRRCRWSWLSWATSSTTGSLSTSPPSSSRSPTARAHGRQASRSPARCAASTA